MKNELRHPETGDTLAEVISKFPNELDQDAVGVWQINEIGRRDFKLSGDAMADFLRRSVLALLDRGAVPVKHIAGSGYEWVLQKQYGNVRDEIADAIVREWEPVPNEIYAMIEHCPWFVVPDPKFPTFVKLD
jgi:hypothetical protein